MITSTRSLRRSVQRNRRSWKARRGQALVPVVMVVVILTTLAVAFTVSASREVRAASNFNADAERFYAAKGALNYAMSSLSQVSNNGATYGIVPPGPDTDANGWMQMGDAWVKIEVTDTGASINLNNADTAMLNKIPILSQNPDLVACMIDWRTTGDTPSDNGAKTDYYQSLNPPYNCKDAPYDSVEELLLVKGFTPTILYGSGAGNPVAPDSNSTPSSGAGGSTAAPTRAARSRQTATPAGSSTPTGGIGGNNGGGTNGGGTNGGGTGGASTTGDTDWTDTFSDSTLPLSELFTTTSVERNIAADGTPRVNINTATAQDLQDKVGLSATLANRIVQGRQPATTGGGGGGVIGGGGAGGGNRPGGGNNGTPRPGTGGANGGNPRPGGGGANGGNGGNPRPGGASGSTNGGGSGLGGTNGGGTNGGGTAQPGAGGGGGNRPSPRSISRQARPGGGATGGGGGTANPGGNTTPGGNNNNGTGNNGNGTGTGTPRPGGSGGGTGGGGTGAGATVYKTIADLLLLQGFTQSVMQQIADKISVDDQTYHANLVNVNTAPAEVLALVPGMDHATLNAILQYRQGGQAFQSLGDIFSLQNLTRQQFQNVIAGLCTKTSVYKIHIKVRTPGQQGVYAVSALVQLTDTGPQVIKWQETPRTPGWSLWSAPPSLPKPTPTTTGSNITGN